MFSTSNRTKHLSRQSKAQVSIDFNELRLELASPDLRTIGNYAIGELLGSGSYGIVKKGLHKLTGQEVAIKIVDKSYATDVVKEVELWRKLDYPRIIRLYEVLTSETKIYLVMELAKQGELLNWISKNGRTSEQQARLWFGQIAAAVAYIHRKNLVHRDLKLENILLDDHLNVKLMDFGFAREYDSRKMLSTYCGSFAYAAPEMLSGTKYKGPEVDVWSLGVILFAILCGELPFPEENNADFHHKISNASFVLPDFLSKDSKDLISRLLKAKPEERCSMDQIFLHPWLTNDSSEIMVDNFKLTVPKSRDHSSSANNDGTHSPCSSTSSLVGLLTSEETQEFSSLLSRAGLDTEEMFNSVKRQGVDTLSAFYSLCLLSFRKKTSSQTMRITVKDSCAVIDTCSPPLSGRKTSIKPEYERSVSPVSALTSGLRAFFAPSKSKSRSPAYESTAKKHDSQPPTSAGKASRKPKVKLELQLGEAEEKVESAQKSPSFLPGILRKPRWSRTTTTADPPLTILTAPSSTAPPPPPTAPPNVLINSPASLASKTPSVGPRIGPGMAKNVVNVRRNSGDTNTSSRRSSTERRSHNRSASADPAAGPKRKSSDEKSQKDGSSSSVTVVRRGSKGRVKSNSSSSSNHDESNEDSFGTFTTTITTGKQHRAKSLTMIEGRRTKWKANSSSSTIQHSPTTANRSTFERRWSHRTSGSTMKELHYKLQSPIGEGGDSAESSQNKVRVNTAIVEEEE